ncbi:MAG: trigger factor [Deltaproteobacteria bacterium]|nr:trigger factor [Deltaproteobacteria bacterium]
MTETAIQVEMEDLGEVKRKLAVVVPKEEVKQEVDRAYRNLGKHAKVKGFRPGKVPRAVLEMYYKKQVEQEVSDALVRRSLEEAIKEKELDPVGMNWPEPMPPVVEDQDYRYVVELEIPPKITVENYFGMELQDPGAEATDEMVEARLNEIREANAVLQPIAEPRPVAEGDYVILDYQGYFAGQALEEAKGENVYLEVGTGKFNKDFERHLVGLMPGGETRFAVDLPTDFFNPLIAGKTVEFAVKVHEIKERVQPDLDDAFAQSLGGKFETMADLREAVRQDIINSKERERQAQLEQQVLDKLIASHSFELPPSLIRQEQESMLRDQLANLQQYNINIEGLDFQKMLESVKPRAEFRVRSRLLLEQIAKQEGISVEEAEVEAALQRLAESSGRNLAQVREFYREQNLMDFLRRDLRQQKTMKMIIDRAELGPADSEQESA